MNAAITRVLSWWVPALLLLAAALLTVSFPGYFAQPLFAGAPGLQLCMKMLLAGMPLLALWLLLRKAEVERRAWLVPAMVCLIGACFAEHLHHQFVDKGHYLYESANTVLQVSMHRAILELSANVIPHSYRFLSCSIVSLFEWLCGSFTYAQHAYRILFNALLLGMVYRLGRLYLGKTASVLLVPALLVLYPVTIAWYAGQSLDPISHLSFVVCFYLLSKGAEAGMVPTLVLGVLAKESVAAVALSRIFFGKRRLRAWVLASVYGFSALAAVVAIRLFVNRNTFGYERVSGVGVSHVFANLRGWDEWSLQYLFSLGVLVPGAILGWRLMPVDFRRNTLYVTVVLVLSSALFSWLNEVRNLVPALVLLLVVNLKYFEKRFLRSTHAGDHCD